MIDIARDPRWGRMAEGCGEDTYLTTVMGVAMVKGFQGDSLNSPTSIASCPKHFVGYGAAEGGRITTRPSFRNVVYATSTFHRSKPLPKQGQQHS